MRKPLAVAALALPLAVFAVGALAQDADPPAFWGQPSVNGGQCCNTLGEVRSHIDALDRQIVALIAERGQYVAEAGRFKKDPAAVSAPARVEAIVARVKAMAAQDNLAPEVAERTYRALIAAFEDYERAEWVKRNPAAKP